MRDVYASWGMRQGEMLGLGTLADAGAVRLIADVSKVDGLLTGSTYAVRALRPDGVSYIAASGLTAGAVGGVARGIAYTLTAEDLRAPGALWVTVRAVASDGSWVEWTFAGWVSAAAYDGGYGQADPYWVQAVMAMLYAQNGLSGDGETYVPPGGGDGGGNGGGDSGNGGLVWPGITWSGPGIKRRLAQYQGMWYAEYACWDATAGTAFTLAKAIPFADFWLVGPGLAGSAGSSSATGNGGGAGAPVSRLEVALAAGTYTIVISASVTSVTGIGVAIQATTPAGGYASGSKYLLYGDAEAEYGTVTVSEVLGGTYTPGQGATGCTFLPVRAADTVYARNTNAVGLRLGAVGIGAGGNGGSRTDLMASQLSGINGAGPGAGGLMLMRVPV